MIINAKLLVEVQWGVIPGTAEGNRQWAFDREQIEAAFEEGQHPGDPEAWRKLMHEAFAEMDRRTDPRLNNWATLTWLWL